MASPDDSQEKSQQATPFKLEQARKRGTVARSADITSFAVLLALLLALGLAGVQMLAGQVRIARAILGQAGKPLQLASDTSTWLVLLFREALLACLPLLLAIVVAPILANLLQSGPVFSMTRLAPDWSRINPLAGLRRMWNVRLVVDAVRAVLKTVALALAAWLCIRHALPRLAAAGQADARLLAPTALDETGRLLRWCLLALLPVVLADLAWVRLEFLKKMRMSRREIGDEHKQREGDPRIRSRLRALQREARTRSQSLRQVRQADVLLTNPTRIAVALRYDGASMAAPAVVAKGAGQLARLMRDMARRHRIPVVENRKIARALFRASPIGAAIPQEFYPAVARLLVWVASARARAAGQA